jgi:hypothetical protein
MWKPLRLALGRFWQWSRKGVVERRMAASRARFWAELREGEREAEDQSRP